MQFRTSSAVPQRSGLSLRDDALPATASPGRLLHLAIAFAVCMAVVLARVVQLEFTEGSAFRAAAAKPLERRQTVPAARGRILSADGHVLAYDERISSLAVHYRYLEDPPSPRWLRRQARARVPRAETHRAARLTAELAWVREYREGLLDNLATLCGRPSGELTRASAEIQRRVQGISARVNDQQQERNAHELAESLAADHWQWVRAFVPDWLLGSDDRREPARIVVAEELDYHVLVNDVPLEVVAEIESQPDRYPGLRIVEQTRRRYPAGTVAANIVGHVGPSNHESPDGARTTGGNSAGPPAKAAERDSSQRAALDGYLGAERQFDQLMAGHDGLVVERTDHGGNWLGSDCLVAAAAGRDVLLTVDLRLQRIAEEQLDRILGQTTTDAGSQSHSGGAVVLVDVHTGAILAAATAPRFNPNAFVARDPATLRRLLNDPGHPLFDRVTHMALPPGSVFKVVTALALLAQDEFDPRALFDCQGFLSQPDRERCQIFRRYGIGHGPTDLERALVQSCNVYFFQHAQQMGTAALVEWARHTGFGATTGVDLPGEAAGNLPDSALRPGDARALAIGQGALTATPLQLARMMAMVANGGRLVTPHVGAAVVEGDRTTVRSRRPETTAGVPVPGLAGWQLQIVRRALEGVVNDPDGTAYLALGDCGVPVAGKTGTAESGRSTADHAWFAGYAPNDEPRVAVVVVLEHGGAADRAALVAKELLQAMHALGLLASPPATDIAEALSR